MKNISILNALNLGILGSGAILNMVIPFVGLPFMVGSVILSSFTVLIVLFRRFGEEEAFFMASTINAILYALIYFFGLEMLEVVMKANNTDSMFRCLKVTLALDLVLFCGGLVLGFVFFVIRFFVQKKRMGR